MIFLLSLFIFILDQLSKIIIVRTVNLGDSLPVVNNIFHITLVFNRGAAFGIFARSSFLFIVISVFIIAFIIISSIRRSTSLTTYSLPLSIILGGALGNLVDRLRFGFVVDFLDFRIWPVFNIADTAITIGAILLILKVLKSKKCTP